MEYASNLLIILACLLAFPVVIFSFEIIAALLRSAREAAYFSKSGLRKRAAVIIPAHNEGHGIVPTIEDIRAQLLPGDRLLVVADNCTDDTAIIASEAGAEVIERRGSTKRIGRGYALGSALKHLSRDPPAIIICVDADCRVAEGTITQLAIVCAATHRPIQAFSSVTAKNELSVARRVAEFAWRVKNWIRPFGLSALGLPCQLMGTGMAFPWELIRSVKLVKGALAEDEKLAFDLTKTGRPPLFCLSANITSQFTSSAETAKPQRKYWDKDGIRMVLMAGPRLMYAAICDRNLGLFALTLDLMVPPLLLLVSLIAITVFSAWLALLHGFPPTALFISAGSLLALASTIFLSWLAYGRDVLPVSSFFAPPRHVFAKSPFYRKIFSRSHASPSLRTDRSV